MKRGGPGKGGSGPDDPPPPGHAYTKYNIRVVPFSIPKYGK